MSDCRELEPLIDSVQAGEAGEAERERLLDHLDGCPACAELFEQLTRLRADGELPEPTPHELVRMRLGVWARIDAATAPRREPTPAWRPGMVRMAWSGLAAAAVFVLGLWLGGRLALDPGAGDRIVGLGAGPDANLRPVSLVEELRRAAVEPAAGVPGLVVSNLRAAEGAGGRVRLSFDAARRVDVELDRRDPLLAELLAQSLLGPTPVGTRLRAIDLAPAELAPRVRQALVAAMRGDENLGVRLAAQERLAGHPGDDEIGGAMLEVLEREPSVQMRLAAIDYLAASGVGAERLARAIDAGEPEGVPAVRVHAGAYLTRADLEFNPGEVR
jgi:hypothetical protein